MQKNEGLMQSESIGVSKSFTCVFVSDVFNAIFIVFPVVHTEDQGIFGERKVSFVLSEIEFPDS